MFRVLVLDQSRMPDPPGSGYTGRDSGVLEMRSGLLALILCASAAAAQARTIDGHRTAIIDAGTIGLGSERVRILNIDPPNISKPQCARELATGLKAKERLSQLLQTPMVEIYRRGRDSDGRTLARVAVPSGGVFYTGDVGEILVAEGLALPWRPGPGALEERRRHWCG